MEYSQDIQYKASPTKQTSQNPLKSPVSIIPKTTRPASSHGVKLSANMSSQAKKDLILRLEEWKKAKRQTMVQSFSDKLEQPPGTDKSVKPPQPPKTRPSVAKPMNHQSDSIPVKNRESVFERLYKNAKVNRKNDEPTLNTQNKSIINKNKTFLKKDNQQPDQATVNKNTEATEQELYNVENVKVSDILEENNVNDDLVNSSPQGPANMKASANCEKLNSDEIQGGIPEEKNVKDQNYAETFIMHDIENDYQTVSSESSSKEDKVKNDEIAVVTGDKTLMTSTQVDSHRFTVPKYSLLPVANKKESQISLTSKTKPGIRRSISMLYRKKKALLRTPSEKNLHEFKRLSGNRELNFKPVPLPSVKTPFQKEKSLSKPEQLFSPKIKKGTTTTSLRNKLEGWLKTNGHSLDSYRHLRCFGIDITTENGLKTQKRQEKTSCSPQKVENEDKENVSPAAGPESDDLKPELWLNELFRLIVDLKYPPERCEEWLAVIRKKCPTCTELPIYWECLSAFRNDLKSSANEKVEKTDDTLVEMFDKMALENQKASATKIKLKQGMNPENIFQSTVVKFSVQPTKTGKESTKENQRGEQFVATPVRRSSRIKTPCKGTFDSLRTLTPDLSNKVTFKTNESLLNRF